MRRKKSGKMPCRARVFSSEKNICRGWPWAKKMSFFRESRDDVTEDHPQVTASTSVTKSPRGITEEFMAPDVWCIGVKRDNHPSSPPTTNYSSFRGLSCQVVINSRRWVKYGPHQAAEKPWRTGLGHLEGGSWRRGVMRQHLHCSNFQNTLLELLLLVLLLLFSPVLVV